MVTERQIRKQFEKVYELSQRSQKESHKFDMMMSEYYGGVHYSDADRDELIDALDYGTGRTDFYEFNKIMKEINKQV